MKCNINIYEYISTSAIELNNTICLSQALYNFVHGTTKNINFLERK